MKSPKIRTHLPAFIAFFLGSIATVGLELFIPEYNLFFRVLLGALIFLVFGLILLFFLYPSSFGSTSAKMTTLQNSLDTATKDLEKVQELLIKSEKMASLGGLVAKVTHEVNTPIGVSVTASSFLSEKTRELNKLYHKSEMRKQDLEEYLSQAIQSSSIILTNLERASNLIRSFKTISVDQSTDQKRDFKLKDYFQDVFVSLHPPDKRLHISVETEGDNDLVISSYPGAFAQIITNLYINACIHAFEDRTEGIIKVDYKKTDQTLWLCFSDNGKGMDDATIKQIYEPFFTTRRNSGGSGLGMSIVFNLVTQKLGGTIKTVSKLGEGTQFILDLPFYPPNTETEPTP